MPSVLARRAKVASPWSAAPLSDTFTERSSWTSASVGAATLCSMVTSMLAEMPVGSPFLVSVAVSVTFEASLPVRVSVARSGSLASGSTVAAAPSESVHSTP